MKNINMLFPNELMIQRQSRHTWCNTPHTSTVLTGGHILFRRSLQFRDVEADLENPDKTMQSTNPHKGLMVLNYNRSFNILWDKSEIVDKQFRTETSWNLVFYYKLMTQQMLIAHNISTISRYIAMFLAKNGRSKQIVL